MQVNPGLGIRNYGMPAAFLRSDYAVISKIWRDLFDESENYSSYRDYSEDAHNILAGRCITPANKPVYWAVRDNRVYFSHFKELSEHDKMIIANQVLTAFAPRSEKDDLKSAALATSKQGHFYIAMNTQEPPTMDWDKQCAESNITKIIKQFRSYHDEIVRMYVLGGLTDGNGNMRIDDHLIGMCMRCVETVSPIMSPYAKVIIIPANDGKTNISLTECERIEEVKEFEAWQVEYRKLKAPSILNFPDEVKAREVIAFQNLKNGNFMPLPEVELKKGVTEAEVNHYMLSKIKKAMDERKGEVEEFGIVVMEITKPNGVRFETAIQIKGKRDNATLPPINTAINQARLQMPSLLSDHVSKVYVMGYNINEKPYNMNAEVGERLIKRVIKGDEKKVEVICIPLNDGIYPTDDIIRKTADELAPTAFRGSRQHPSNSR